MVQCPACLPPDNAHCATCGGTWSVSQKIADEFIERESKRNAAIELAGILIPQITNAESVEEIHTIIADVINQID